MFDASTLRLSIELMQVDYRFLNLLVPGSEQTHTSAVQLKISGTYSSILMNLAA